MTPGILALMLVLGAAGPARASDTADPRARAVLEEMTKAYRRLRTLEQETTYQIKGSELGRLVKSRLVVQRPNKLFLEITENTAERVEPVITRHVWDGRDAWTYYELRGWFTQERAPRDFRGSQAVSGSVELAAIAGVDLFGQLAAQARSVRLEAPAIADGVETDVVYLDVGDDLRSGEIRLFVGRQDRLLRRFTFDSAAIPSRASEKPAPPLLPGEEALEPLAPPRSLRFAYDNRVTANHALPREAFRWIPPPGALRLNNSPLGAAPQGGRRLPFLIQGKPVDLSKPTEPTDLTPSKVTRARDLIEKARRQRTRKP